MAGRVYETMFELGARINSSFGSAFTNAQNQLEATSGQTEKANTMFGKLGAGLGVAAVGIGAAALAAGGLAVSVSDDLQKSLNGVQSASGIADDAMAGMKETMIAIYNDNFGENFEEIGAAMTTVSQQTGLAGDALKETTESALLLKDTFELEVADSVKGANQLMKQFGDDSTEAYNLIAQGAQSGLNANGDLLDTLNEYGGTFAAQGFSSVEMFNMLSNASKSGIRDVDLAADAIKEFGIRSKDGSTTSAAGFDALGLNAASMTKAFATGGDTAKVAFSKTTAALLAMKDPVAQNAAGVALFGAQFEDMGIKGITALVNTQGSISKTTDALGKINAVKYNTFGEAMEGIKRNLQTGLLLPLGEKILPKLNEFAGWITANMPAIQNEIEYAFNEAGKAVTFLSDNMDIIIPVLAGVVGGIVAFEVITTVVGLIKSFQLATEGVTIAQWLFNAAMTANPIGIAVVAIAALIAAGVALWMNWDTVKAKALELWEGVKSTFVGVGEWFSSNVVEPIKSVFSDIGDWFDNNVIQPILGLVPNWLKKIFSGGSASASLTVTSDTGDIPGNAEGTDNWRGGLTWVGEQGPELVNLPSGAQVFSNPKSLAMVRNVNQNVIPAKASAIAGMVQDVNQNVIPNANSEDKNQARLTLSDLEGKLQRSSITNNDTSFAPVFSPQITIEGNADEATVTKVIKMSFDEFKRFMKQYENDKHRLQFSPS